MKEDNEILVEVEGLSKKFCKDLKTSLWYGVKDLISNIRGNTKNRALRKDEFWAVKDVSFQLRRGECLGLIGHNGAGKSTLLKILNGLINPDDGKVTIRGRVGALIELGAGFNPILTGYENIYNNGAILGFTKAEIDTKLEDIIEFAEIREFINMPVQNYSSGMKVRLGFAIAAQMELDVLIIDEVLAVGDVAFRMKCYNTITSILPKTAVIFVSHSMPQVSKLCTSAVLLSKGKMKSHSENISNVINDYFLETPVNNKQVISGSGKAKVLNSVFGVNENDNQIIINKGECFNLNFDLEVETSIKRFAIRLVVYDTEFKGLIEINSMNENLIFQNNGERNTLNVELINPLNYGNYSITLIVLEIMDDDRIGERLLRHEGFYKFKSLTKNKTFDSYIPLTIDAKWN